MNNATVKTKRKKIASLDARKARAGWVFVLPFVLCFIIIYLPIIVNSIRFSFNEIVNQRGGGYILNPVGLGNYRHAILSDPDFVKTLTSGIQQLIFDIPAIVIFALFMAVLLNQKMVGRAAFRAIFFIPVIISTGLIDGIDQSNKMLDYMGSETGIEDGSGTDTTGQIVNIVDFEMLFYSMKVGTQLVEYVVNMVNNIYNVINRSGVQMLIYLAGLQSISPAIYESCEIDGATAWETFWKITFPMISPMILVNAVYTVIDSFTSQSNVVMTYIQTVYLDSTKGGEVVSSAMSWIYFLIVLGIIGAVAALLSAYVFYQKRD